MRTALGIELGSTRIKACLVDADDPARVLATGDHEWENQLVDDHWTYSLDAVWSGLQAAYTTLVENLGEHPAVDVIGVSAMMHGYLAFDASGELLVPFRTWRDTTTGAAAAVLTTEFGVNIPLRWSVAHLYQAVLDAEPHVPRIASITTLAGYVHWKLTGRRVLGIGDASGMFPIDDATRDYRADLIARFDALSGIAPLAPLLPEILGAGTAAGELTAEGAALLDPSGALPPGIPLCPPEGDAGTGMVATNAVAPRAGNVSAGTSIFAMVVLERALRQVHEELDVVTTPAGDPVAMVHCNNGASELGEWVALFRQFSAAAGAPVDADTAFDALFRAALEGSPDAGGLLAYNQLAGEPIAGLPEGRPLVVRTDTSDLSLPNFMRAQLYGVFATLSLGMGVLDEEGVTLDRMFAHGGVFRTAGVAQRFLAAALRVPVSVAATASEGGPWGMAVLAAYSVRDRSAESGEAATLAAFLRDRVFAGTEFSTLEPQPDDLAGFTAYLDRYKAGLAIVRTAAETI